MTKTLYKFDNNNYIGIVPWHNKFILRDLDIPTIYRYAYSAKQCISLIKRDIAIRLNLRYSDIVILESDIKIERK